jgi:serpin B
MTKISFLAALLFALPAAAQAPAPSDATGFALALHRAVAGSGNVMTSPYSLREALGMAYVGSAGETRSQMARVLGAGSAFEADEKAGRKSLEAANGSATLKIANALFVKEGYVLLPRFLQTVKDVFAADVFVRPFGPAAVDEINRWASAATNGKIPTILGELKPDDRAVLLNAVYFKGSWVTAFPKVKSGGMKRDGVRGGPMPETFAPTKGKPFPLNLMSVNEKFQYVETPGAWQAVRLPYKGDRLAMIAVLPDASSSLAAFRAKLDAPMWGGLRAALARREGLVAIPKFKFAQTYQMIAPLKGMGMTLPFDSVNSDFSGTAKPASKDEELYISEVIQKTFVAVDEEGTEAAAVTAVIGAARGSAMHRVEEPFRFVANRPFLFVIEEVRSGEILFIGEVHDPR